MTHDPISQVPLHPSRGRHSSVTAGTCLMEMASVTAGEPFSDHPTCVQPALALSARLVNDYVGDAVRQSLVPLLEEMMAGPRSDLRAGPVIALSCLDTALVHVDDRRLRRQERRLLRHLERVDRGQYPGALNEMRVRLAVFSAVRSAAAYTRLAGQEALAQMLTDATHAYSAIGCQAQLPSVSRDRAPAPAVN